MRRAALLLLIAACAKLPTKENSRTPPEDARDAGFQPDPDPPDSGFGEPFDANGTSPYDAGCPDAMPEAGAECFEYQGSYDCKYVDDASVVSCDCVVIPESDWWRCTPE